MLLTQWAFNWATELSVVSVNRWQWPTVNSCVYLRQNGIFKPFQEKLIYLIYSNVSLSVSSYWRNKDANTSLCVVISTMDKFSLWALLSSIRSYQLLLKTVISSFVRSWNFFSVLATARQPNFYIFFFFLASGIRELRFISVSSFSYSSLTTEDWSLRHSRSNCRGFCREAYISRYKCSRLEVTKYIM